MSNLGINHVVIHPQWGAPMSYHKILRVETDMQMNQTFIVFASFYSKEVYEKAGTQMSSTTISINDSVLRDEADLLQAVVSAEGNQFSGAKVDAAEVAIDA